MTEHDGLTFAPVFVKNLDAVFSCDRAHNILALVSLRAPAAVQADPLDRLASNRSQVCRSALTIHTSSKLVAATSSWRRLGVRKGKLRQMPPPSSVRCGSQTMHVWFTSENTHSAA